MLSSANGSSKKFPLFKSRILLSLLRHLKLGVPTIKLDYKLMRYTERNYLLLVLNTELNVIHPIICLLFGEVW